MMTCCKVCREHFCIRKDELRTPWMRGYKATVTKGTTRPHLPSDLGEDGEQFRPFIRTVQTCYPGD